MFPFVTGNNVAVSAESDFNVSTSFEYNVPFCNPSAALISIRDWVAQVTPAALSIVTLSNVVLPAIVCAVDPLKITKPAPYWAGFVI